MLPTHCAVGMASGDDLGLVVYQAEDGAVLDTIKSDYLCLHDPSFGKTRVIIPAALILSHVHHAGRFNSRSWAER